ncbi:MAG TPA: hypothetical protein VM933_00945 [Acidimicrobiales bacterium]|nr:hypothetical protein [Acidimicrobiales bacterium]
MTAPAWWAAVPAATTILDCGDARHELRWEAGQLHLEGHADVEAERTLGALGAEVPTCLRVRDAWAAHATDPALVTLGRRPGEPGLGFAPEHAPPLVGGLHTPPKRPRPSEPGRREALVTLLSLPVAFVDRLALTAMADAAERWPDPSFRERHGLRLGAGLAARAGPALHRFGRPLAAAGEVVLVHATPCPPAGRVSIRAERTGRGVEVSASLPISWLSRVWGPGLSEPDGRFVIALRRSGEVDVAEWMAVGVDRWEAERRPAQLARNDDTGAWRLRTTRP